MLQNLNGLRQVTFIGHDPTSYEFPGLMISNNDVLSGIDELYSLTEIDGSLTIGNNPKLSDLSGLHNLKTVGVDEGTGNSIDIGNNTALREFWRFGTLKTVPGSFQIAGNENLEEIHSMDSLKEISGVYGRLIISNNPRLRSLEAFSQLTTIKGTVNASLVIIHMPGLTDLTGLQSLRSIEGPNTALEIRANTALTNVRALNDFSTLTSNSILIVKDNTSLREACGFYPVLANWDDGGDDSIDIANNGDDFTRESIVADGPCPKVCYTSVNLNSQAEVDNFASSLQCGQITGDLNIQGADITNLDSLYSISQVDGSIHIQNNPELIDITGLGSLMSSGLSGIHTYPGVHITDNAKLPNLDGLEKLTTISGMLVITNNAALENIDGLSSLANIGAPYPTGNSVTLTDNPALKNIHGFRSIKLFGGAVEITNNNALVDLTGLDSVRRLTGNEHASLTISGNESLESLQGLNNLEAIWGRRAGFRIAGNPKLRSLDPLAKLRSFSGSPNFGIGIVDNVSLENVDGLSGATMEFIAAPSLGVTGNVSLTLPGACGLYEIVASLSPGEMTMSGNGPGVTRERVLEAGPCDPPACVPPMDKHVFAEYPSGEAPHSTNIIVANYEEGIMYELRRDSDNSLVAGPWPGNVGLFAGNITETTTYYVVARRDSTCHAIMAEKPIVTIEGVGDDCTAVTIADKFVTAEQDTLSAGEATNIIVFDGDDGVEYLLRNNATNDTLAGPWPSSVGLYTSAVWETTNYNVLAIDVATGCSQQMTRIVTITIPGAAAMMAVYPNPSAGEFTVQPGGGSDVSHLNVIDGTGMLVKTQRLNGAAEIVVDMKPARPGIYYLSVYKTDGSVESKRVVIRE